MPIPGWAPLSACLNTVRAVLSRRKITLHPILFFTSIRPSFDPSDFCFLLSPVDSFFVRQLSGRWVPSLYSQETFFLLFLVFVR